MHIYVYKFLAQDLVQRHRSSSLWGSIDNVVQYIISHQYSTWYKNISVLLSSPLLFKVVNFNKNSNHFTRSLLTLTIYNMNIDFERVSVKPTLHDIWINYSADRSVHLRDLLTLTSSQLSSPWLTDKTCIIKDLPQH